MRSLIPWKWGARRVPVRHSDEYSGGIYSLQSEMNRLFEDFFRGMDLTLPYSNEDEQLSPFMPSLDLTETHDQIIVTAEVPGMSEKELDVSINNSILTIRGEKKEEKEENLKGYYKMERKYGSFQRSIPLPQEVDTENIEASFKNGVLKICMPKLQDEKSKFKSIKVRGL